MQPDPELTEKGIQGDLNKERVGGEFKQFVQEGSTYRASTIRTVDENALIVIAESTGLSSYFGNIQRDYYRFYQTPDGQIKFLNNASAIIYKGRYTLGQDIVFHKFGEFPAYPDVSFSSQKERLAFLKRDKGYQMNYALEGISDPDTRKTDGSSIKRSLNGIEISYEAEGGGLNRLEIGYRNTPSGQRFLLLCPTAGTGIFNTLGEFMLHARGNKSIIIAGVRFDIGFNESGETFEITIFDEIGRPEQKLSLPMKADIQGNMEDTGAKQLLADPFQPVNGITGKSFGDIRWLHESFPDLTGIRLTSMYTTVFDST